MKTLLIDIETSPNLGYCWGIWQQDIRPDRIVSTSTTLCWSAKWLHEKKVMFDSVHQSTEKQMLKGIHSLLGEAEVVVSYNGKSFDVPTLNKEFVINNMEPPSPYTHVDLIQTARGAFRFQSNKLDHIAQQLGIGKKAAHEGFQLWISCMKGDRAAWGRMRRYNIQDTVLLEKLYDRFLPWIKGHPNHSAHAGIASCPKSAAHTRMQKRGSAANTQGEYDRFQCLDCGSWARGPIRRRKGKTLVAL